MSERPGIDLEEQVRLWATDVGDRIPPFGASAVRVLAVEEDRRRSPRRRYALVAAAAIVVLVAVGVVAWRAALDDERATVVVDDGTGGIETTVPPAPTNVIDTDEEVLDAVREQIRAAGLEDAATVTGGGTALIVVTVGGDRYYPVAPIEAGLWISAETADAGDPVASYRDCVEATGDPDAAPCADSLAASNPDLSGRVWLGDEQVRASPLFRLDALDGPPSAYFTSMHVITAAQATDRAVLDQLLACDAAMKEVEREFNEQFPPDSPSRIDSPPPRPDVCDIPGVIR